MKILEGKVLVNGTDIWTHYGVFLCEERRGGHENLNALLAPAKAKSQVAVDFREQPGEKYPEQLTVVNEARDVTLLFALYAASRTEWLAQYRAFIAFLKAGQKGWLTFSFPDLGLTLRMFYKDAPDFRSVSCLWLDGVQAGRFKVRFREPQPEI